jgi:hypothetical protein
MGIKIRGLPCQLTALLTAWLEASKLLLLMMALISLEVKGDHMKAIFFHFRLVLIPVEEAPGKSACCTGPLFAAGLSTLL